MKLPSLRSRVTYCRGFRSQLISSGSQYRFTEVFVHSCFTSVIPTSSFRKSRPIYGSVCPFLLYFRNFSRDPSGSQCRFTEVFAHSCFTSVIPTSSFWKSRPIYGSVCPFLLYFRNSVFIFPKVKADLRKCLPPFLLYFRNFDWIFLEVNAVLRKYMSIPALLP